MATRFTIYHQDGGKLTRLASIEAESLAAAEELARSRARRDGFAPEIIEAIIAQHWRGGR
jgi:hypothetical protein